MKTPPSDTPWIRPADVSPHRFTHPEVVLDKVIYSFADSVSMENTILVTDALKEQLGLPVFEVSGAFDEWDGPVILGANTLEDLKSFIEVVEPKTVLVQYDYTDEDELFVEIENDVLQEMFGEDWEDAREYIDEHNSGIVEEDWDAPYAMNVFVMYKSQPFGVRIYNDAYQDDLLIEPEDFIVDLMDGLMDDEIEE